MGKKSFFRKMAEEKGILDEEIIVEHNGKRFIFDANTIIRMIESSSPSEQKKIKDTFSLIDFNNGDLLHYIRFLAEAFVKHNYV